MKKPIKDLKVGDVILPPARELSLWMRRWLQEHGLPEKAVYLTITGVYEGLSDKGGRWFVVKTDHAPEWNAIGGRPLPFTFRARPDSLWPIVEHAI